MASWRKPERKTLLYIAVGSTAAALIAALACTSFLFTSSASEVLGACLIFSTVMALISVLVTADAIENESKKMRRALSRVQDKYLPAPIKGEDLGDRVSTVLDRLSSEFSGARRRVRAAVENAVDVVCALDESGAILAINQSCRQSWGYEPAELARKLIFELIADDELAATKESLQKIIASKGFAQFENRIVHARNGTARDMLWTAHWIDEDNLLFCVVHDITESRELDRMKRDFVAMVTHDLKTPLCSVQMCLSLIQSGAYGQISDRGKSSIALADANVTRLVDMVERLLRIDSLEAGNFALHVDTTTVSEFVQPAVQLVSGYADKQNVSLIVEDFEDVELVGDTELLTEVVSNLISNAVKFSPAGSSVIIKMETSAESLKLTVSDRGRGIPLEMQEQIFDRFKQVEQSDRRKGKGTGLGLAICKAVIEKHNGKIGVLSSPGEGSQFWFEVPRRIS